MNYDKTVTFRIAPDRYDQLFDYSVHLDKPISAIVREAVHQYMDKVDKLVTPLDPPREGLQRFYFTFGLGTPMKSFVQPIEAVDEEAARTRMWDIYGPKWAFCYPEEEYLERVASRWHYDLLPVSIVEFD